jgi:hypothetical protein
MPFFPHMIAQGVVDIGDRVIDIGHTVKNIGWAFGELCGLACVTSVYVEALARQTLRPEGLGEVQKRASVMLSPGHRAEALRAFSTLQKAARGAPGEAEAVQERVQKKMRREAAALERLRTRRKKAPASPTGRSRT